MKRLIIVLGILLVTLIGSAQVQQKLNNFSDTSRFVPDEDTILKENITPDQVPNVNGWAKIGEVCSGCPSFFYRIQRTAESYNAEDRLDYFYFYFDFFSNSYYTNGSPASTYLQDINFYADSVFDKKIDYLLLNAGVSTVIYGPVGSHCINSEDIDLIKKMNKNNSLAWKNKIALIKYQNSDSLNQNDNNINTFIDQIKKYVNEKISRVDLTNG